VIAIGFKSVLRLPQPKQAPPWLNLFSAQSLRKQLQTKTLANSNIFGRKGNAFSRQLDWARRTLIATKPGENLIVLCFGNGFDRDEPQH
jgi:hypothetical protein